MCHLKLPLLYSVLKDKLRTNQDYTGCIGHTEIKMILCRSLHVPKPITERVIKELQEFKIINYMGRNSLGLFYKVN